MRKLSTHAEWLRLVEISGPFLSTTTLERVFPQGLEAFDTPLKQRLRSACEEWQDAVDENDRQLDELHREWVRLVIEDILEYDKEVLVARDDFGSLYSFIAPDCDVTFIPDLAVKISEDGHPRLFISIQPPGTDLEKVKANDGWPVPIVERMTLLCRSTGVRLGLVTNGERWMLVNAPVGSTSSHISWYSRLWFQEPITLKAFLSLLGVRRCFGPSDETLDALLEESLKQQEEVTDTLGEQVRRAVEVLVQCLDKADQDRNRELLHDVSPAELYEAGLTIMMRLVFVLCAEERGLLLLDDPIYDQYYAISTLRSQLAEEADRHGPEVLDRRHDAWARLLAVFRAIYGGVEHESLRMPAMGGSLFDPDRFPLLEGRTKGTKWRDAPTTPLPIDNRTVLLLLEALQVLEQPGGALLLSYKALDVENIGHVYEGLLEHTVARVPEVTLGLIGSQKAKNPNITLRELEDASTSGEAVLNKLLLDVTQRSESAIRNGLNKNPDDSMTGRVLTVCGDGELASRIMPFANLLRTDAWDEPIVYRSDSFMVTLGADRRETGTHYTPKSLTESIVTTTLEPVVYVGPSEGKSREEWTLKSSREILELKFCDPAMGSGAFLVQACRYLGEKLVESWLQEEIAGKAITIDGEALDTLNDADPLPSQLDERLIIACRLVAERCLYGVDLNPLAVELAKLSIWLVTLAKGRPFGFLDHNLRSGDSLLGIHRLEQLTYLCMSPKSAQEYQLRIFGQNVNVAVKEAIDLRLQLRKMPIRDIRDVEAMAQMDANVRRMIEVPESIADAFIGEVLASGSNAKELENSLSSLTVLAWQAIGGDQNALTGIHRLSAAALLADLPANKPARRPFHWPLEFPEVFARENNGFDGIIGNPPYFAGAWITSLLGATYRAFLVSHVANGETGLRGTADLCTYFILKVQRLVRVKGTFGLVLCSTVREGDSKQVGLSQVVRSGGTIFSTTETMKWPGTASVDIVCVSMINGQYSGAKYIGNNPVPHISAALTPQDEIPEPSELYENKALICKGHELQGDGFKISVALKEQLISMDPNNEEVIFPLINGEWLNNSISQLDEYVINFEDRSIEEAKRYPTAFAILEERVKPDRLKYNANTSRDRYLRTYWWLFRGFRTELKQFSIQHKKVLALSVVSKYSIIRFIDTTYVPTAATTCILSDSFSVFSQLQSSFHETWARSFGSSLGERLRYIAGRCFKTYPLVRGSSELDVHGHNLYELRERLCREGDFGYTALYNRFHDINVQEPGILSLREKQTDLDIAVSRALGWHDLELCHDFHEVPYLWENDRIRFTISEHARLEVLRRLSELNHQRYEEEVKQGLHSSTKRIALRGASSVTRVLPDTGDQVAFNFITPVLPSRASFDQIEGGEADVLESRPTCPPHR